jgi:BTB/POZ domain/WD domain, G-beta repeat
MANKRTRIEVSSDVDIQNIAEELEGVSVQVEDTMKSLQNILIKVSKRVAELKEHEKKVEDMEETMRSNRDKVASILKLNVRGKKFTVYKDTLIRVPGTYFFGMLSSSMFMPDFEGEYFIDRFHEGFDRILEYLRTGVLSSKGLNEYEVDCVYDNLNYFNIPHQPIRKYQKASVVEGFKCAYYTQLQDGRVCGGTGDKAKNIRIYNMDTGTKESTLLGHTDYIRGIIQLEDGRLCSCSDDKTIRLWSIDSGENTSTINGHTGHVNCILQLLDGRLCSGSQDSTVRVWSKNTGACDLTINTESPVVSLAILADGRVYGGLESGSIKLFSLITGACASTFKGHTGWVRQLLIDATDSRLYSCSKDGKIKVWNTRIGVCERTLEGHSDYVTDMVLLKDGRLCSSSIDGSIKLWNASSGVCERSVDHGDGVKGFMRVLQLHDGRLLSQNLNCVLYLWD